MGEGEQQRGFIRNKTLGFNLKGKWENSIVFLDFK